MARRAAGRAGADQGGPEPPPAPAGMPLLIPILVGLIVFLSVLIGVVLVGRQLAQRRATGQGRSLGEWIEQLEGGESAEARREAAEVIARRGPEAVAAALQAVTPPPAGGEPSASRSPAVAALAAVGPDLIESLIPALSHPAVEVRLGALRVFRAMTRPPASAVEAVGSALSDENRWVRWAAAETLGDWGPEAAGAAEALAAACRHADHQTRLRAVRALGRIGPPARAAVPAVRRAGDEDPQSAVRRSAARALIQMGAAPPRPGPAATDQLPDELRRLTAQLTAPDPVRRALAAEQLGAMGPAALPALPALRKAASREGESDADVRAAATEAAQRIEAYSPRP